MDYRRSTPGGEVVVRTIELSDRVDRQIEEIAITARVGYNTAFSVVLAVGMLRQGRAPS